MKKIAFVIMIASLFFSLSCTSKEVPAAKAENTVNEINWLENVDEALTVASEKNVPVFIHFTGSDWCGWCKKLKAEVYDHSPFIDYADKNLVMVKLDYPRSIPQSDETKAYNQEMLKKFRIQGFPTVVLLNSQGAEIGRTGYQQGGPEAYIEHLKTMIK